MRNRNYDDIRRCVITILGDGEWHRYVPIISAVAATADPAMLIRRRKKFNSSPSRKPKGESRKIPRESELWIGARMCTKVIIEKHLGFEKAVIGGEKMIRIRPDSIDKVLSRIAHLA